MVIVGEGAETAVSAAGPTPEPSTYGPEVAALDLLITVTGAALSLPTVLETALTSTASLLSLPMGAVLLWDEVRRSLRLAAQHGLGSEWLVDDPSIPEAELSSWLSGRVFTGQAPAFIADLQGDPAYASTEAAHRGLRAVAAVPLIAREQPLGVLLLGGEAEHAFSPAERHILLAVGRQVAVAIDNARLYQEATRRAEQMRLVAELGQRLSAILDLEPLLQTVVAETRSTLRCRLVGLGLLEGDQIRLAAAATPQGLAELDGQALLASNTGICAWVVCHRAPHSVPDVALASHLQCPPPWHDAATRALVAVPLLLGDRVLGILQAASDVPAAFDAQDLTLLQAVANQTAVAIGNARAYAASQQQARQLRALLSTTRELSSTLDLRQLLATIAQQARSLIGVDSCVITLLNRETGTLSPVIALHQWADQILGMTLKLGQGITGHVAQTGVGEIVNHADADPRALTVPGTPVVPEALLASPLQSKGEVIGVMTLSRLGERQFSSEDLELLNNFAGQAAIAVENVRLYTESRQRARELERAHSRLQKAQDQLLQAEKLSAVGQLAGGMAHELNNPLTAIMGFAQLLEEEQQLSPEGRADARRIVGAVGRAKRIVANLLTFSRQQRIAPQQVDLPALVERILRLHGAELEVEGVTLEQHLDQSLPEACVDPAQIEQLLLYLLRNAHRATQQAGGGTVTLRLGQSGAGRVRIEVADEGPGIPADVLPRIFDPFFTTAEAGEGPGLGLSACYGIVQAHKGRIWAEPRPEGGSLFGVELPLDPSRGEDSLAVSGRTVLVVTGDEAQAEALLSVVEEMGHRATCVESAEAALAEVVVRHYDLLLCDATLPGMSIGRLHASIGAADPGLATRFVAVGDPGPGLAAVPRIEKPVNSARAQEAISAHLA